MTHQSKFSLVFAVLLVALGARPAAAQTCIQDVWKAHGNNQNLTCSAKDVNLSDVTNITITAGGACSGSPPVCKCFLNGPVTFVADFKMNLTADTRYDIGFYIATDGDNSTTGALTGQCSAAVVTADSSTFINLDAPPLGADTSDKCGDITGALGTAYNPQIVRQTITMPCIDSGNGQLALPWCTTWRQPGSNTTCQGPNDAYPGSPSKCNCGLRTIPIFTEPIKYTVAKQASPNVVPETTGGSVLYTVTVTNQADVAYLTLNKLNDDKYGDLTSPTNSNISQSTCALATIPGDSKACPNPLPNGSTVCTGNPYTCTFLGTVPPGDAPGSFTDTVTACGTDQLGQTLTPCPTASATVTYSDVPMPPTVGKSVKGLACQIDATYSVTVTNNSTLDTLTLSSLNDSKFGDITSPHSGVAGYEDVVSTTCSLPSAPLPVAGGANINTYACSFVGRTNTCVLNHMNVVTATAQDSDTPPVPYSVPSNSATINISVTKQ